MDDDTVQTDSTSTGEESNATPVAEPTMAETVQATVDKAVLGMESRMKQSARDTARFEASKKSDDGVSAAVREALGGLTLESGEPIGKYLDAADRDARLKKYEETERTTAVEQQRLTDAAAPFYDYLTAHNIDRNDPRLDWAADEPDRSKAIARWHESIDKIRVGTVKTEEPKPKAAEENFVDTAQTTGTKSFSIPTKKEDFGPWLDKLPYSVYKEHKEEIEAAHNSGQMK